ncbi:protein YgfX [Serratia sp. NPDC078593]|uniref:protein YgfX n=1 Tax=unclassified Serratia (in: enterobacteria) TaxID=2647522 RepID=UPI0037D916AF
MAQWRCNVRISWRTQLISLLAHGALILLILISPWPEGYGPIWLILLTLVVFECIRSQKRIASHQGELHVLSVARHIVWEGKEWRIIGRPWMPHYGIMLKLQPLDNQKSRRMWLASDCMRKADWRQLRQHLLFPSAGDEES